MHFVLGIVVILFNLADNLTTFLCLRAPVPGFEIVEANPAAAWLFGAIGLLPGLALETVVTSVAVAFLVATTRIPSGAKLILLIVLAVLPAWAAVNNALVMHATDIAWSWS